MLDNKGFDLWADGYDKSVGVSDEENTYPFAGYKDVLGTIYKTIMEKPNAVVLDIGFGTGTLTTKLYENGCTIYGQDFSARMIELASGKMPHAHLYQGDFTQGLVEPLLRQSYDFIVATYSLHHLSDEQKASFLRVLRDHLNPGGRILIGDVTFDNRRQLEQCRKDVGDEWDDDEIYFVVDELKKDFPSLAFTRISYCAGILSLNKRSESVMTIIKNDIPILEYDADPLGVIMPDHEHININLPKKAVFAFLRDDVDRYAKEHNAVAVAHFESATKEYPVYLLDVDGQQICLVQAPVGAPAATQILDWLIAYGVREIISCGSCGVLVDIPENAFLVPCKALRDEGTSYHYLPPERFIDVSEKARYAIEKTMKNHGLPYMEVVTWSTDGFFRETKEKVAYRKSEGCSVVEMECSALAACAKMRGAIWGELLFTADTLADAENYDERNWGDDSASYALELCIEAVLNI